MSTPRARTPRRQSPMAASDSGTFGFGTGTIGVEAPTDIGKPPTKPLGHGGLGILPWSDIVDVNEPVPELAWPNSIRMWEQMRHEAQIESILKALTMPIRRYGWHIDPNGARDEVVRHIAGDMGLPVRGEAAESRPKGRLRNRFSHDDHMRHAFLALPYGHMFFEQDGVIEDDGLFHLRRLLPRMPGTIMKINVARDGGLVSIVQYPAGWVAPGRFDDPSGIEIKVGRLVAYVNDREGGNWIGRSLFRTIYKNWLIKDRLLRVDAMKHERNGMGVPVIEAPLGATPKQIKELSILAQSYVAGEQSGAAIPNGATFHLKGVDGALPDTIGSVRYHDQQMARTLLEMFLELGTTKTGAQALGTTFIDFFDLTQEAYAEWYAQTTTAHVIEDIVDWNWGPDEPAPRLGYDKTQDKNLAVGELVALITSGAITVDTQTEEWIRESYKLPEMTEDRPAPTPVPASVTEPAPVAPADTLQNTPAAAGRGGRVRRAIGKVRRARATDSPVPIPSHRKLRRAPTAVEASAKVDFARLEAEFDTARDDLLTAWAEIQDQQMVELSTVIAEAIDNEDWAALGDLAPSTLGITTLTDRMTLLASTAIATAVTEVEAGGVTVPTPTVAAETIAARAEAIAGLLASALGEVMGRKALAYAAPGQTGADVAAAVVDYVNSLASTYLKDRMTGALMTAQNEGRYAVFQQIDGAKFYASELLDSATCGPCESVDGSEYDNLDDASNDYPSGGYVDCEGGDRCRGTLVAVMADEAQATGDGSG